MSNKGSVMKFGPFHLDPTTCILYREGTELAVEPKLLEVLLYLLANRDRYVPLSELHEELWAGRIVTDTAVRRTISKLRSILEDDTNNPQFIKSLPKRGYKIVAEIDFCSHAPGTDVKDVDETSELTSQIDNSSENKQLSENEQLTQNNQHTVDTSIISAATPSEHHRTEAITKPPIQKQTNHLLEARGGFVNNNANKKINRKKTKLGIFLAFGCVITLAAILILAQNSEIINLTGKPKEKVTIETIETFPSDKTSMAVSDDGTQLAFTARMSEQMGYQLFIKDLNTGYIKQISKPEESVMSTVFLQGSREIGYVSSENGGSVIKIKSLDNDSPEPTKEIFKSDKRLRQLDHGFNEDTLVVTEHGVDIGIQKTFSFNRNNSKIASEILSSDAIGAYKFNWEYSPSRSRASYFSISNKTAFTVTVHILDLDSQTEEIIGEHVVSTLSTNLIYDSVWLNDDTLIINGSQKIIALDANTLESEDLIKNGRNLYHNVTRASDNEFLAMRYEIPEKYTVGLDTETLAESSRIPDPLYAGIVGFVLDNDYYYIQNNEDFTSKEILKVTPNKESKIIYDSPNLGYILGISKDNNKLIVTKNRLNDIIITNLNTGNIDASIPTEDNLVSIQLSTDRSKIFFTSQLFDVWQAGYIDIESGASHIIGENISLIQESSDKESYYIIKADRSIYKTDKNLKILKSYSLKIPSEVIFRFRGAQIKSDILMWSTYEDNNLVLHTFNFLTEKKTSKKLSSILTAPFFVLSNDGKKIYYRDAKSRLEIIDKITIN
ncbi:hypothetical protein MAH1_36340 [Sessilibacter sp. MAH1]